MHAFLDTEFTDLVIRSRLLSVGLVTDRGSDQEFYAEVTDPDRIHATNWFGLARIFHEDQVGGLVPKRVLIGI